MLAGEGGMFHALCVRLALSDTPRRYAPERARLAGMALEFVMNVARCACIARTVCRRSAIAHDNSSATGRAQNAAGEQQVFPGFGLVRQVAQQVGRVIGDGNRNPGMLEASAA